MCSRWISSTNPAPTNCKTKGKATFCLALYETRIPSRKTTKSTIACNFSPFTRPCSRGRGNILASHENFRIHHKRCHGGPRNSHDTPPSTRRNCSFGFLTTFLLEDVPSRVKKVTILKKCLKMAKK